ncbi:MAG TPA: TlpA family protein disulfide reductase [Bacteroidetes bacterium]|nr:TlpA family protein disulfide reductase [Bacteroidota bacterium]
MKTVGTLLLLCILTSVAGAQIHFSIKAKGLANDYIFVEKPLNGKFFPAAPEKILMGKKNRFIVEVEDETPGFLKINFGNGRQVRVFIEPGKTSSLEVDMADFEKSLKFSGPQAPQNKFLNQLERKQLSPLGAELMALKSFEGDDEKKPKDYYLDVLDYIEAEKKVLKRKGKKRFSKDFIAAMEQDITYYYTCLFSEMVATDYRAYSKNQPSRFTSKWAYYWKKIFELQKINSPEHAVSEYYLLALDYYLSDYRLGYQGDALYPDPDLKIGEQYLEYDRLLWNEFPPKSLEYSLAAIFSYRALLGKNEPILFDLFQKYKNDFPASQYLKPFENAVAAIGESLIEEEVALPDGIIRLDKDQEINSMDDILNKFKGKVIYMDIWATWCSPCLFEFRQKQPLEEFVQGKDIVLVFVSVDNEDRSEKWQKTIQDNDLKGYHIIANYSLRDELINKFGDGSNLALPHYIIYTKNGKLADGNAKNPSRNNLLFNELQRYLENEN